MRQSDLKNWIQMSDDTTPPLLYRRPVAGPQMRSLTYLQALRLMLPDTPMGGRSHYVPMDKRSLAWRLTSYRAQMLSNSSLQ